MRKKSSRRILSFLLALAVAFVSAASYTFDGVEASSDVAQTLSESEDSAWSLDILKTDEAGNPLEGAEFELSSSGGNSETIDIEGTKTWEDDDDEDGDRPESITFRLYADGIETRSIDVVAVTKENDWRYCFDGLPKYDSEGNEIEYSVTEDAVYHYSTAYDSGSYHVTNTHTSGKTSVTVMKVWDDDDDRSGKRPDSVDVSLFADGEDIGETLTLSGEGNVWIGAFTDVDKYNGTDPIDYTIQEEATEGYESSITGDPSTGFIITNTSEEKEIETTSVLVTKIWDDNDDQDGLRPDNIVLNLYADDDFCGSYTIDPDDYIKNEWELEIIDLPKYSNGKEITYSIGEMSIDDYAIDISGNQNIGFEITNTHIPETVNLSLTKVWDDNDDQDGIRPKSITCVLTADGQVTDCVFELREDENWKYDLKGLPKYQEGCEIQYDFYEETIDGYKSTLTGDIDSGFVLTNTHVPDKGGPSSISFPVMKIWDDNDDQDGIRPDSVTVDLLDNGEVVQTVELNEDNDWTYQFSNLPYSYADHSYSVQESTVDGYEVKISGEQLYGVGFEITNTHIPETVEFSVEKIWDDDDDSRGYRPESIAVVLLADGEEIDAIEITENDNWQYIFKNLPKYENNGVEITYTIGEVPVDDYTTDMTGDSDSGYKITNKVIAPKLSVSGNKAWNGNHNSDDVTEDNSDSEYIINTAVAEAINPNYDSSDPDSSLTIRDEDSCIVKVEESEMYYPINFEINPNSIQKLSETSSLSGSTDSSGSLTFSDLTEGTFTLTEIEAPDGYIKLENPITIVVTKDSDGSYSIDTENSENLPEGWTFEDNVLKMTIPNEKEESDEPTYGFDLDKTDSDTGGNIENAIFALADESGEPLYFMLDGNTYTACDKETEGSSAEIVAGDIHIEGLSAGTYILAETKAPAGYIRLKDQITITIDDEGNVSIADSDNADISDKAVLTIQNSAMSLLPNAGGPGLLQYLMVGLLIIGTLKLILEVRKREQYDELE